MANLVSALRVALSEQKIDKLGSKVRVRLALPSKRGRPFYFMVDTSEPFEDVVKRMNDQLQTVARVPVSADGTLHSSTEQFRENDLMPSTT